MDTVTKIPCYEKLEISSLAKKFSAFLEILCIEDTFCTSATYLAPRRILSQL